MSLRLTRAELLTLFLRVEMLSQHGAASGAAARHFGIISEFTG